MKNPLPALTGAARVGWMVIRAKGGHKGAYWSWRRQTAFGSGDVPTGRILKATAEYSRWVSHMRRLAKGRSRHG